MASPTLEQRIALLEAEVEKLRAEMRAAKVGQKDWRRTIGAFTGDEGMQQLLQDAMQLREADRKSARIKRTTKGKRG